MSLISNRQLMFYIKITFFFQWQFPTEPKKIINFNISLHNDLDLVMQHIKNIETNTKTMISTDHGLQYSSGHFRFIYQKKAEFNQCRKLVTH